MLLPKHPPLAHACFHFGKPLPNCGIAAFFADARVAKLDLCFLYAIRTALADAV